MFCGTCGAASADTNQVCPSCGRPLTSPPPPSVGVSWPPVTPQSPTAQTSGKAIASLVLGFLSWMFPAAIAAVILGHISRGEIRGSAGRLKGEGLALTGLIFGYLGVAALPVLIIAAFTIPKLTKAIIPAHEASAIASIKAINEAEMLYASSHPVVSFTADLAMLGGTAQSGGEQTIDNPLASGRKSGYTFTYTPGEKVNGAIRSYTITAVPDQVGSTGQRRFFSDESGDLHYNADGAADVTSPVIGN